jgi:hypothetical protein
MPEEKQEHISKLQKWKKESENNNSQNVNRWVKNMHLSKGVFDEDELKRSAVRKRSKIFFRKIWATTWRILASFHAAFLRDPDNFSIEGRDLRADPATAKVLQKMVEYRRDVMMRKESLFLKFIWGFQNILNFGWTVGLLSWETNEDTGKDGPTFRLFPNEQVFADFASETKENMRFIIFEDFMTKDEMESLDYKNIDKAKPMGAPSSQLRAARYIDSRDPLQNPGENEYPAGGRYKDEQQEEHFDKYRVYKSFWWDKGKMMYSVTDLEDIEFVPPEESVYGDRFPVVMGTCLTEAHKMVGEGFPEPMEGPQESYNHNLNQRKDNVALSLNGMSIVSRFGGVDYQSLVNSRPGGVVMADDINAVKERDIPDVTQGAYMEANADDGMMQELGGVTAQHLGLGRNEKATVAQINQVEGNAKIDLYIAIVGETFVRDFYSQLAYLIQRFETDEKIFSIANEELRREGFKGEEIFDLDFEADAIVNVGLGTVGRQQEIQQTMLAMDRAIMSNQAMVGLASAGLVPPEGLTLFNTNAFIEDVLPKLGKKDLNRYFINVPPPPPEAEGGGVGGGVGAPGEELNVANQLQAGGFGG